MDTSKLYDILVRCTTQYRTGPEIVEERHGPIVVVHVYQMAPVEQAPKEEKLIDVVFMTIGINMEEATACKDEFVALISEHAEILATGPSYITLGGLIGSQDAALQFIALGVALDLWKVLTPKLAGVTDPVKMREMAGGGFLMMSPYPSNPETNMMMDILMRRLQGDKV